MFLSENSMAAQMHEGRLKNMFIYLWNKGELFY